jgi:HD superfamily phosphohydrolase
MARFDLWDQVAQASEKWYEPPAPELLGRGELRALYRRAATTDATATADTPLIAYPSALPLNSVDGNSPRELGALFFSPLIIRLNSIAQLSTTYMRANIDAKHCRLSHSLGTLSILSTLLDICVTRIKADDAIPRACLPSSDEIIGAFTYAALHDAFQGPFGHALDALREDLIGGLHGDRRLDKTLLGLMLSLAIDAEEQKIAHPPAAVRALASVLYETVARPQHISLIRLLRWLHHAALNSEHSLDKNAAARRRELSWLFELLEGPLDADRWDYLWRDTLHLGFVDDHEAIRELLWEFWADVRVAWDGTRSHIVVSQAMADRLGQTFFPLRKNLYRQVYENPEKRIIDGILIRCIYLMLLAPRPVVIDWNKQTGEHFEFLCNLAHITDSDLLSILDRAARVRDQSNYVVLRLVRALGTYPAVRIAWRGVVRDEHFRNLVATSRERLDRFSFKGILPPKWATEVDDEPAARVYEIIQRTVGFLQERATGSLSNDLVGSEIVALALHCSIMPVRPARVLQFERIVWKLIRAKESLRPLTDKICRSIYDEVGQLPFGEHRLSSDEIEAEVGACPPIFVSFPWIADLSEASMREMTRDRTASSIFVDGGREGILEHSTASLMPKSPASETYVAAGGYPLLAVQKLNETERAIFDLTLQWAIRRVLYLGCCLALPRELVGEENDKAIVELILANEPEPDES